MRGAWSPKGDGKPLDLSRIKPPTAGATGVYPRDSFDRVAAAKRELAALERDAAVSKLAADYAITLALLLQAPEECSKHASLLKRCRRCYPCRVDKFLRDAGAR